VKRRELRWDELLVFKVSCGQMGVELPKAVETALHLVGVASKHEVAPEGGLLGMTDEQVRERVTDLSIRQHRGQESAASSRGMLPGVRAFKDELAREVRAAVQPELERIVTDLQPRFAESAAPLVTAARQYGFTAKTDPADVIDLADEKASAAYRDMRTAWLAVQPIASFRILISRTFDLSPTINETTESLFADGLIPSAEPPINWSVLFAEGGNWSLDAGYLVEGSRGNHIDWLALAAGGLRLNTPDEARAKVHARQKGQA
jgi:hypothetical protein